jgi:hypothetical protein
MSLYRQIILLTLTLLVLVSSTGMAVGMHLCGGDLRDITFFGAEAECLMEHKQKEATPPCHPPKKTDTSDNTCCQDQKTVIERQDVASDTNVVTIHKLQDIKFLIVVNTFILQLFEPVQTVAHTYALYESPPLPRDIPILGQAFLL